MSSISWQIGAADLPVYVTAKAGIVGLTRALAREFGPAGIRVNSVQPGWIWTDRQRELWLTPETEADLMRRQCLKRLLAPVEVARLVLFLAADDSAAITNQTHIIDGGWV
jgi:NAD(P)-dependent dehydrogenase (short-subunit alcohol dehydrogenase family)